MRPAEEINKLIKKINLKASANLDKRISESISGAQVKQESTQAAHKPPNIWRDIMKNPVTKLASAAAIIIAVFVISMPFNKSGVAWGALAEKIESVKTVVHRITADVKMFINSVYHGTEFITPPGKDTSIEISYYRLENYKIWGATYRILKPLIPQLISGKWSF